MNILQAIRDDQLFRPFLADSNDSIRTWDAWTVALRCLYGIKIPKKAYGLVKECTGRDATKLPTGGFKTALFLTGRRSGKSRIASIIASYEAALSGRESKLAKGEQGLVVCISPTKRQSQVVRHYIRGVFDTPLLLNEIGRETTEGFSLNNGVSVETLVADWRTVRNFSLLSVILDECAFLGYSEESKVRSDTELVRAIKPGLATTGGRLIAISSPYAQKGWCYTQYKKNFGNDAGKTLVWNCSSRTMNSTLPQSIVDDALEEDRPAALAEYMGQFRQDVCTFVSRDLIESLVVPGRQDIPPQPNLSYVGFADVSGGRVDDAALAIAHREGRMVIIDCLKRYKSPHNPHVVVAEMVKVLREYRCDKAIGDAYAAEWTKTTFEALGIKYERASKTEWSEGTRIKNKVAKPRSQLYMELLPRLHAAEIELPDNDMLITQLSNLERRTRSGGRDTIDHGPGGHDDLANAVAGACNYAVERKIRVGILQDEHPEGQQMEKHLREREKKLNAAVARGTCSDSAANFETALRSLHRTDPFFNNVNR